MDRRAFLRTGAAAAVALTAGCSVSGGSSGDYDVGMSTSRFRPDVLTVPPGTTVTWKNTSSHAHTVTAYGDRLPDGAAFFASGGFDTTGAAREGWRAGNEGALFSGDTFEHTFEATGEHHYLCIPHETAGMVGTVVVEDGATVEG